MLAANLFCGPVDCVQCVENTDLQAVPILAIESGMKVKNSRGFNQMEEYFLNKAPLEIEDEIPEISSGISKMPTQTYNGPGHDCGLRQPTQTRNNGPGRDGGLRQRSFSAKDLQEFLKDLEKEAASTAPEMQRHRSKGTNSFQKLPDTREVLTAKGNYPNLLDHDGKVDEKPNKFNSAPELQQRKRRDRVEKQWQRTYLDCMIAVGDVLAVADTRQIARLGGVGGMFGHVLVVTEVPRCIKKHAPEGSDFFKWKDILNIWPEGRVREIYQVPVMESTRSAEGIHETDLLLYVDPKTGRMLILGEVDKKGVISAFDNPMGKPEEVELWQCPPELRDSTCRDLKEAVIGEMKKNQASWSWGTAVRAFLLQAQVQSHFTPAANCGDSRQQLLKEVQDCWQGAPICTSLPIIFWQRYLHKLSESGRATEAPLDMMSPIDMIMMFMPMKADRTLPGELLKFMQTSGWTNIQVLPTQRQEKLGQIPPFPKGNSR